MFLKLKCLLFLFLILNFIPCGYAINVNDCEKIRAPFVRATKGSLHVLLLGSAHELPLTCVEGSTRIKEAFQECQILFVENNYPLPLSKREKHNPSPIKISEEGKRQIGTVLKHVGHSEQVEDLDPFSQLLALSFFYSFEGMDTEIIKAFKTTSSDKKVISLDKFVTREEHEEDNWQQYPKDPSVLYTEEAKKECLDNLYRQLLKAEPENKESEIFHQYKEISQKLLKGEKLEHDTEDGDHTHERTEMWFKETLQSYFTQHSKGQIGILVGAEHFEAIVNWLKDSGFQ